MSTDIRPPQTDWARTASRFALYGFLAVIAFFLWTEHRAHLFGALPYLLLLLCPAMHLFMHRGHGGGHAHDHGDHHES